jgi:NAD+ diphosphatase
MSNPNQPEQNSASGDYYWPVRAGQLWLPDGAPSVTQPPGATACFRIDLPDQRPTARHWIALSEQPDWLPSAHWYGLRELLDSLDAQTAYWASRALQIAHWWSHHRYCSRCGTPLPEPDATLLQKVELVRICSHCQYRYYPVQTPCIIVVVTRGEYCLLAQHQRSRTGTFTALAGYVESGEPIEQTVQREVFEEVGLTIAQPRYSHSQSWPFPAQLMLGFYAEYQAGEISLQVDEIRAAHWYHYTQLPKTPPEGTIARQLINGFVARCQQAAHKQ